jgi:hypothetical protein
MFILQVCRGLGTNVLPVIQNLFHVAPGNMRLYYYDQEMSKVAGPEEMKWNSKVCACAKNKNKNSDKREDERN